MGPANFLPKENTLPSPIGTVHQPNSAKEGRAEWLCPTVQIHWVQLSWKVDPWSCLPLQTPLLITVDQLPKQRKKLGMGMAEKEVGKNSRNMKPNSKLYSANQFFDQKFQNRENHEVQKLF